MSPKRIHGKILLVEDDMDLGGWAQEKLEKQGLEVTWCPKYSDALERLKTQAFHALVTDVFLENHQALGLDLVKHVESLGIPTIVMSSAADLNIAKTAINHGASFLLEKPFQIEELTRCLVKLWEEPRGLQALLERFLDLHRLTPKEKEVARLLLKGLSNKEMADIEGNTDRTIKSHLTSIFAKCGVTTRTELFNAVFPT